MNYQSTLKSVFLAKFVGQSPKLDSEGLLA